MQRPPTPLSSIIASVAALSAAPVGLAVLLALAGEFGWISFGLLAVGTIAVATPLVVGHRRGLARIADYAAGAAGADAPDIAPAAGTLAEVAEAVGRLARRAGDQQRQVDDSVLFNAMIIENLPNPLMLIGVDGVVVGANLAARTTFGARLVDHDLSAVIRAPALLDAIADVLDGAVKREIDFEQPVPVKRSFSAIVERLPVEDDGGSVTPGAARPAVMVVFHDLTAIKRTEQLRAEFVADVSHELRTPLSALVGFVETLATSARDDPTARERFLTMMDEQGRRMSRLIDDLLSLSKIELDEHTRPAEMVDLGARARAVAQALDQRAERRGIRLTIAQEDPGCMIVGEADQVYEVIENLVENAIRYSRDNSEVTIRLWRAAEPMADGTGAGTIGMAIQDHGEGIGREHLPRITERFYRVDKARSRAMGGTGLGLAIVKHIVSRHRAAMQIESRVGEGSTFSVYWPAAAPTRALSPPAASGVS